MSGRAPSPVPGRLALAAALIALGLCGCAAGLRGPATPVTPAGAARLQRECPAGTFLGTMSINCPQPVE